MNFNLGEKLQFIHNIDLNSTQIKFLLMLVFILIASFLIDFLLSRSFLGKGYRIFAAPGVIVHELSHALMCLITGAKITKISLFDKEGGSVHHSSPRIPILGQILISLSPFVVGAAGIYFLSKILGINSVNITELDLSQSTIIETFKTVFLGFDYRSVKTIIILYLVLSIAVTMTPSWQDLRNIALSILGIAVSLALVYHFTSFSLGGLAVPEQLFVLLSTVSLLLILSLFLSIILYIISKLVRPA
jgi:hypothetical protein